MIKIELRDLYMYVPYGWLFLNQARASQRPAHTWFFEIASVRKVCMCLCVCVYVCVRPQGY